MFLSYLTTRYQLHSLYNVEWDPCLQYRTDSGAETQVLACFMHSLGNLRTTMKFEAGTSRRGSRRAKSRLNNR